MNEKSIKFIAKFEGAIIKEFPLTIPLDHVVMEYLANKCNQNSAYFERITNALYEGLHRRWETERDERIQVEYTTCVCLDAIPTSKLNRLKKSFLLILQKGLSVFKYNNMDSEIKRVDEALKNRK